MVEKKNYENMRDDTWKRNGHIHDAKQNAPEVCPRCGGLGYIKERLWNNNSAACPMCGGLGEIYK